MSDLKKLFAVYALNTLLDAGLILRQPSIYHTKDDEDIGEGKLTVKTSKRRARRLKARGER